MITRRRFVSSSVLTLACPPLLRSALGQTPSSDAQQPIRLAILGSVYRRGSNLQTIADRFLVGFPYNGDWHIPNVKVVSMYVDERMRRTAAAPTEFQMVESGTARRRGGGGGGERGVQEFEGDLSSKRAEKFGFRLSRNIPEALRCGSDRLAVDAVLAITEQGSLFPYATNDKGQTLLPRYDFFEQCSQVFESEKRAVPYFNHKQLSHSFSQADTMVKTADRLKFSLMSGSSMPVTWRLPDTDIPLDAPVQEVVMVGVGGFDGTDFDALDAMQAMLERRKGGETGVKAVQLLEGDDVWQAGNAGRWSKDLLTSALSRSDTPMGLTVLDGRTQDLVASGVLPQLVEAPAAYCVEYLDGTKATLLLLNGAIKDFNIAARVQGDKIVSTQFFMPPAPNETYSACLASKIEQMYQTRNPPYPVQRTLLTTGILEACLESRHQFNQKVETPHLKLSYKAPQDSQYIRS